MTGNASVSDIQDPSPYITYNDEHGDDCLIIRTWFARDHVGNIARKIQKLKLILFSPIKVRKNLLVYVFFEKTSQFQRPASLKFSE